MNTLNLIQIEHGVCRSIETAVELYKSARIVGKKKMYEVASSLLLLSIEEIGQAILIYRTILLDNDDKKGWNVFWNDLKNHNTRLLAGIWQWADNFFNLYWDTQWGKSIQETQKKYILEWNETKKQGFYTYFDEENKKFKRIRTNFDNHYVMKWIASSRIKELNELKENNFFEIGNLKMLQGVFSATKGRQLLQKYKIENKLKSSPALKKEYDEFIKQHSLSSLDKIQKSATAKATDFSVNKLLPRTFGVIKLRKYFLKSFGVI